MILSSQLLVRSIAPFRNASPWQFLCWIILSSFPLVSRAQEGDPLTIASTPDFVLTGTGSAPEWNVANWVTIPARKGPGRYATRIKVAYSQKGIYCLFDCQDSKITSTQKKDFTDLYNEDVVEAFFWPNESAPVYFEYELSPYRSELAIMVPNLKGRFYGWRPWNYEGGRLTRREATISKNESDIVTGWIAEFFIPYALLNPLVVGSPKKGSHWRANFYRIDYDQPTTFWSWRETQGNFHDFEHFGTIVFE